MSGYLMGRLDWNLSRDQKGHRDYSIDWLVVSAIDDGPGIVLQTAGLPSIGSTWAFGNDNDPYARCWPDWVVKPVLTGEPGLWWKVTQRFTTKPLKRCQDSSIENPLSEPADIGGSFLKYTEEATHDRNGAAIKSSSHEMFRGKVVEFDANRPTVTVGVNVLLLPLGDFSVAIDNVNDSAMWGVAARKIKLDQASWQRLLYGTCTYYYRIEYELSVKNDDVGFDRDIVDEGTKVLIAGGDKTDPADFELYKDVNGENTRVLLDGDGAALGAGVDPNLIRVEKYEQTNLLGLPGMPAFLG